MLITKQDGTRETFDDSKLRRSLKRAGCSDNICNEVIAEVSSKLHEGETTTEIYRQAFDLLRQKEQPLAARYSMKRAVLDLGPSGFPFEHFIGELFRLKGFEVVVGREMQGACTPHEVDVCACKDGRCIGLELKFHNRLGFKTDLKVALYVRARIEDIQRKHPEGGRGDGVDEGWLVTNTKFTSRAIAYGKCSDLTLVAWTYPEHGNLQDLIEEAGVQPVTALTTLTEREKRELISRRLVLCRSLRDNRTVLRDVGLSEAKMEAAIAEGNALCGLA